MGSLHATLIGFVVVGAMMVALERTRPGVRRRTLWRKGWLTDVVYWFFTPLVSRIVTPVGVLVVAVPIILLSGRHLPATNLVRGFGPVAKQPHWLQAIEMIVIFDFIGYWSHRLFHGRRLWPFHAVHHSSKDLDWLAAARVHPVNDLGSKIVQAIPIVVFGFAPAILAGLVPLFTLHAILLHANVDWDFGVLRGVISSPVFHRWHHTAAEEGRNKNFAGLLPLWDLLFGTYYMPGRAPLQFGIDEPMPDTLLGQLVWPFRRRRQHR